MRLPAAGRSLKREKNDDNPAHSWQAFSPITVETFEKCSKDFPTTKVLFSYFFAHFNRII